MAKTICQKIYRKLVLFCYQIEKLLCCLRGHNLTILLDLILVLSCRPTPCGKYYYNAYMYEYCTVGTMSAILCKLRSNCNVANNYRVKNYVEKRMNDKP